MIFKLQDISIRNKLILMQVFTSVMVLSIVFGVFIFTEINSYKQRKMDSMLSLSEVIATNSISTLEFQDQEAASVMLAELHNVVPEIIYAGILNKKGKLFAYYGKTDSSYKIPAVLNGKTFEFTNQLLFVRNPIENNHKVIGTVYLEVRLSELKQIKAYNFELATILLIVALVFSFLIAFVIQNYISKRLLNLVNTMKKVSKTGDYNKPIRDDGKDEIAALIQVFNKLMQQIQESQRRKDEFIGIASHELKTPLTSIKGYIDMLNLMEDQQPKKQFVEKALHNVNKLERLIKDLLDVSKIQSGQLELNMKEFYLDDLLNESISAVQMVSATHLIIREDHLQNISVFADRQRIEQVLINLLSNAIKYSPGENKVLVDCLRTEKELIIKIRDFGIGVTKEEQTNIFDRFYRTKDISIHISGFGLGLYICRDIINRHYGRIWVETAEKGSIFYFSLPMKHTNQETDA